MDILCIRCLVLSMRSLRKYKGKLLLSPGLFFPKIEIQKVSYIGDLSVSLETKIRPFLFLNVGEKAKFSSNR